MDQLELESVLAATGVESLLSGKVRLHKYQLQQAADMPKEIRRRLLKFLATDEFAEAGDMPSFDYDRVLKLVSTEQTPEQAAAIYAGVPDREMADGLGVEANRIRTWADGALPRDVRQTVRGAVVGEPDPETVATFARQWEVANDPMAILRDLAEGCLTDDQVAVVALLYPTLYQEMRQAVTDALVATASRKPKGWEPDPLKADQIATLKQTQATDPADAAAIQAVYAAPQPKATAPRRGKTGDGVQGMTPGQKAAAG